MVIGAGPGGGSMDAGNMLKLHLQAENLKLLVRLQTMNIEVTLKKRRHSHVDLLKYKLTNPTVDELKKF